LGLNATPSSTTKDTPLKSWTKFSYGPRFEAYEAAGVSHDIPNQADVVLDWFDLTCTGQGCYSWGSG
jgi:acetylxylan esterase